MKSFQNLIKNIRHSNYFPKLLYRRISARGQTGCPRRKKIILLFCLIFLFLFPQFLQAAIEFAPQIAVPGFKAGEVQSGTIADYISKFYQWSVIALAVLAVVIVMVSGLRWIFAAGNPPAIKQAQDQLFSALIGLVLILIAVPMLRLINPALVRLSVFNVPPINPLKEEVNLPIDEILFPFDEWWNVGGESGFGMRACISDQIWSDNSGDYHHGIQCDDVPPPGNYDAVCYTPLKVKKSDYDSFEKQEINLKELRKRIYNTITATGDSAQKKCVILNPQEYPQILVPTAGQDSKFGFDENTECGYIKRGKELSIKLTHGTLFKQGDYFGTKCESSFETCVFTPLWIVDDNNQSTGQAQLEADCYPYGLEKSCSAINSRRVACSMCGNLPPTGCSDSEWILLEKTDKVCCEETAGNYRLR